MTRHVVIGTAGHVDHGKTALVRRLTGVDTDRWEEEKRRGITIDLGFAPLTLGPSLTASVVDVPGHEDFVRNMVAGATGVDVALLVVAADEGIMPQTVEHLGILEFLAVRTGVVALTKVDLAEPDWLDLVEADLAERLAGSPVAWEPAVRCSAVTGEGTDRLLAALARASEGAVARAADDLFRLPVDRVFAVAGAGTVVTGTVWSGSIGVGDAVRVLPGGGAGRVRSVEVHGESRERAEPGRRTALALPGVNRSEVQRGSVVVADPAWQEHTVMDVMVTLLPEARALSQRSRVRLHLGTAEVLARVTPAADEIVPGASGAARLRLESPMVARWGDRGILRSYSPVHTIGGCRVIDPAPPARPRRPQRADDRAAVDGAERLGAFVELAAGHGLAIDSLPTRVGIHPPERDGLVAGMRIRGIESIAGRLFDGVVVETAERKVVSALEAHHSAHPMEPGPSRESIRAAVGDLALADYVTERLAARGTLVLEGGTLRMESHQPRLVGGEERSARAVRDALAEAGWQGLTVRELDEVTGSTGTVALAEYLVRAGEAAKLGRERYYEPGAFRELKRAILAEIANIGGATPAQLRDRTGLTRKYLIPVLEWLDGEGFTVRDGDVRRLGPAAEGQWERA